MRTDEQESSYEMHMVRDNESRSLGRFTRYVFEATESADAQSFELIRPVIRRLIINLDLKCDCGSDAEERWTGPVPTWRSEP